MESWLDEINFERHGPLRRVLKTAIINPLANYLPAGIVKALLRFGKSELAAANWVDPGGWRSMVISYDGLAMQIADRILIRGGTIPTALRNRRRLGAKTLARLIDASHNQPVHVLCIGAGPGSIIMDAILQARREVCATLVDLNNDAFEYGMRAAEASGLRDKMRFVKGDARDVGKILDRPADIVKMLGICEYLTDEQIVDSQAVMHVMPEHGSIVFNSLSNRHGTNRFFRRVFGLHMNHRSPEQLQTLMSAAGFNHFISIPEPLGVYHVLVGCRTPLEDSALSEGSA